MDLWEGTLKICFEVFFFLLLSEHLLSRLLPVKLWVILLLILNLKQLVMMKNLFCRKSIIITAN